MICDKKPLTTGERLAALMKKRNMTQDDLSKALGGYSRGYIDKWIHDKRDIPSSYAVKICDLFNVDLHYLLKGTPYRNETVVEDLGLSSTAIDYLKELASSQNDEPVPIAWTDGWTDEEEADSTSPNYMFPGQVKIEAIYPSEIKAILNYLLTTTNGRALLSTIYKYLMIDPSSAVARTPNRNGLEKVSIPVDELLFASSENNHNVSITVWAMPYALKEMISSKLEEIKKEIRLEQEND